MKFVILCAFAFVAAVCGAPTQIQSNNVGDIVSVGKNEIFFIFELIK